MCHYLSNTRSNPTVPSDSSVLLGYLLIYNQFKLLNKILCELIDINMPKLAKKVTIAVPP
ncbi:hypothetical protein Lgor_2735 [Fluoribacter gormanii]|uniref:Uncharacterized protein n=1 Tax=Fluoribacter gormanii TaxID=464 RepID=A0A377GKB2_9GAMM|nr:hypothetical protein Lgor_2735 [Fluoribacter gormanii]SIQ78510.1 hypothetical protein SAMN05421777_10373 [Fluoribacter gormanii]STO24965.1 Uncharacterised protein [Fluoribacter gormanii]